jgi:hypothetical protein
MPNHIHVRDALGALIKIRAVEHRGMYTPYQTVGSVEKKFRDSFPGTTLDAEKWDSNIAPSGSLATSGGLLVMGSGTVANATSSILSKETFIIPFRLSFNLTLSQRIANQSFIVECVSVDSVTEEPDGLYSCGFLFDGTTVTQAKYFVQNGGLNPLTSGAVTVTTTAGTGLYEIEPFADECWFHSGVMDATSARANSYRRHQQIPDPNALYKIRLRWLNGSTAPASNTNASLQFVAMQDYQELTAEITAGRGQTVAGQGIAVHVSGAATLTTNTTLTPSASFGAGTFHHRVCTSGVNNISVKTSAGNLNDVTLTNLSSSFRYFRLYNKASAPVSTDTPIRTVGIPPNNTISLGLGTYGTRHSTGIAYNVSGGVANNDTTGIGADEVIVGISYT